MCPMPKVMRPPIVPKRPRKEIQIAEREACSWRVHQIEVMATKPGEMVASKAPRRKRTVAREAKEEQVAVSIRIVAQAMMFTVRRSQLNGSIYAISFWEKSLTAEEFRDGEALKEGDAGVFH